MNTSDCSYERIEFSQRCSFCCSGSLWRLCGKGRRFSDILKPERVNSNKGDWFCGDKALKNRSKKLMSVLNRINGEGKVGLDTKVTLLICYSEHLYDRMILKSDDSTLSVENDPE